MLDKTAQKNEGRASRIRLAPQTAGGGALKAAIITWLAVLPDDAPELARMDAIRRGEDGRTEGLLTLRELAEHPEVRLHPSFLWRLGIRAVSESFGGRPRYRLSRALEYLRGAECAARREALRKDRRTREGRAA